MWLSKKLKSKGYLKDKRLEDAFSAIDRADFVLEKYSEDAYSDRPLPIGEEQTISQPAVVVFMLELLDVREGDRVMDIGCGSGWTTALLAFLVGTKGKVVAIERIKSLFNMAKNNVSKYNDLQKRVIFSHENASMGYVKEAPYERILVSAALDSPEEIPQSWIEQIETGGVIVFPAGNSIYKAIKKDDGDLEMEKYLGFNFVDYVKNNEN